MPPVHWPVDPVTVVNDFATKRNLVNHGALILHGVWAVDSLHYLAEIDSQDDLSEDTINGYPPDRVDVAHIRWATATCITALDLCAAGLGRILCGHIDRKELCVTDFSGKANRSENGALRPMLPVSVLNWLDDIMSDGDYKAVKATRNALTHGLIRRHFMLPRRRLDIQVGSIRFDVPALLAISRDTAEKHIGKLLDILPKI